MPGLYVGGSSEVSEILREHDLHTESRLARIEAKLDALNERIDEALVTQIKDHGKRIAALEQRVIWAAGWIAGAACVSSALTAFVLRFLA